MTATEKLEQLADKLLIKTQDNICEWEYTIDNKFKLTTLHGIIYLYPRNITGHSDITFAILDIAKYDNEDLVIASLCKEWNVADNNLVKLYHVVNEYYMNSVNSFIDKLVDYIEKPELPF